MIGLNGQTVLVTGATGTVGSGAVHGLAAAGARVRALVRGEAAVDGAAEIARGELGDVESLRRAVAGCALVVHCAADLSGELAASRAVNVEGVRHLVDAMRADGRARLVHISTVSVYDWRTRREFDEDAAQWSEPLDVYGYTKAEAERLVRASGLAATILRPVMVLSMHRRSFWGPLALSRADKLPGPVMPLYTVPYVHIDNLVQAILLAATKDAAIGRAYDVIDAHGNRREYLDSVYAAIGKPVPELSEQAPHITFKGERIRAELGYAPRDRWRQFLDELRATRR